MRKEEPQRSDRRLSAILLRSVTRIASRRPRLTLGTLVILGFAAVALTVGRLEFRTERSDLIDPKAAFQQRWNRYVETFGNAEDVVVVVESDGPSAIVAALEDLGARVKRETQKFTDVFYKFEPGAMQSKGLQYLSPGELSAGLRQLDEMGRADLMRVEAIASRLQTQLADASAPQKDARRSMLSQADRLGNSLISGFGEPRDFIAPWPDLVSGDSRGRRVGSQTIYLMNEDGKAGFLRAFMTPQEHTANGGAAAIEWLREQTKLVAANHPATHISLTGVPVLENDEMRCSQIDMIWASLISLVGVTIVLVIGFRGMRHPALGLVTLVIGMALSFGYATLAVGHLHILSVSFVVILVGLGINYPIVYLERYLELRHEGKLLRPALLETISDVGPGLVTETATTALACFCALLTPFLGIAELGMIAGGGILLCLAATLIALPALIALSDQQLTARQLPKPFSAQILRWASCRFPLTTAIVSLAVVAGIGIFALSIRGGRIESRVRYDYNLLNLQAGGLESVDVHKRVFAQEDKSLLFAVSVADSLEEARVLREKFEALPTVDHVEDMSSLLPQGGSNQTRQLIQAFRSRLSYVPGRLTTGSGGDPAAIGRAVERLFVQLRNAADKDSRLAARSLDAFLNRFENLSLAEQRRFLSSYQQRLADAAYTQIRTLSAATNLEPVTTAELPRSLTSRYIGKDGKCLLQVFPKQQVWDREPLVRFIDDLRQVDPEVTGAPLQNFESAQQIRKSYETTAIYALAAIWLLLLLDFLGREHRLVTLIPPLLIVGFIHLTMNARRGTTDVMWLTAWYIAMVSAIGAVVDFRNLRHAALALMPPLGGAAMMFGILALLGVNLNPANLIVLPLLLGIGVDNGVHVVHDYRRQQGQYQPSPSMLNAVVLTSLTTIIGFGSLMVAAHRGLFSLGLVLAVGVACSLFVAVVPLTAILTLIARGPRSSANTEAQPKAREQRQPPQQQERRRAA